MLRIIFSCVALGVALTGCEQATKPPNAVRAPAVNSREGLQPIQESKLELSTDKILKDIVGKKIGVTSATGEGPADEWTFEANEYRQANSVEQQVSGNRLTVVIFMLTRSNPEKDDSAVVQASGRLRLQYEREKNQWVLKGIENLSFKYSLGQAT